MAFQKFTATHLFDGENIVAEGHVLITTDSGVVEGIVSEADAGDDIRRMEGWLSPGFINCHCHLELSHMKGMIPEGTGLVQFVSNVMTQRQLPEDEIYDAIAKAEDEMIANGIVAVGDICNTALTVPQKQHQRIHYHNFVEASGFASAVAETRFNHAKTVYNRFASQSSHASIVPHAPYSVSDKLWELIVAFEKNKLFTIHNQEAQAEEDLFRKGDGDFFELYRNFKIDTSSFTPTGKSSLASILPKLPAGSPWIFVHNVYTSANDIALAKQLDQSFYWCLCPQANEYITRKAPPVELLIANGCNIVLGTDSLASSHSLNLLDEIQLLLKWFPKLEKQTLLRWATSNGAEALQLGDKMGRFKKGLKPGVLLIDDMLTKVRRLT